jgi:hypothetical protein
MPSESTGNSINRLQLWSGLILLGIFLTGAVAGAGVVTWLRPAHVFFPNRPFPHDGPPFLHELDLTPDQQAKVKALFEHERTQMDAIVGETFPRVRAVHEQTEKDLKALLTPEQWKKWEQRPHHGPMGDHMRHMMGPPGFGGPPPPFGGLPPPPDDLGGEPHSGPPGPPPH